MKEYRKAQFIAHIATHNHFSISSLKNKKETKKQKTKKQNKTKKGKKARKINAMKKKKEKKERNVEADIHYYPSKLGRAFWNCSKFGSCLYSSFFFSFSSIISLSFSKIPTSKEFHFFFSFQSFVFSLDNMIVGFLCFVLTCGKILFLSHVPSVLVWLLDKRNQTT